MQQPRKRLNSFAKRHLLAFFKASSLAWHGCWSRFPGNNVDMIAPRFTLRTGLLGLTAGAFLALIVREAVASEPWAIGVLVALLSVAVSLALQALAFAGSLLLSSDNSAEDQ